MKKRILALILMSLLVLSTSLPYNVYAEEIEETEVVFADEFSDTISINPTKEDDFFTSYAVGLTKSGNKMYLTFRVTAQEVSPILGVTIFDVQMKNDDDEWETIIDDADGYLKLDTASCIFERYFTGIVGKRYRVVAKFKCVKYDGSQKSVTYYSSSKVL